jgi:hypothetical protein
VCGKKHEMKVKYHYYLIPEKVSTNERIIAPIVRHQALLKKNACVKFKDHPQKNTCVFIRFVGPRRCHPYSVEQNGLTPKRDQQAMRKTSPELLSLTHTHTHDQRHAC